MKRKLIIFLLALTVTNCSVGVKSITPSVQENVDPTITNNLLAIKESSAADAPRADFWISPDGKWKAIWERINSDSALAGFYVLKLQEEASKNNHTLFTFWDADVGSGARLVTYWATDSKAVRLKGDTRGFRYEGVNGSTREQPFDFIYLIDTATLYKTP
jgi:hypothetical protein